MKSKKNGETKKREIKQRKKNKKDTNIKYVQTK